MTSGTGRLLLCVGFGFSARALSARLRGEGFSVAGTSRSDAGVGLLEREGREAILFDGDAPSGRLAQYIARATHILVSVPPDADGDRFLRHHAGDLAGAASLSWLGYLSTVGVYGDQGGRWVDETSPTQPSSARSRWRELSEQQWQAFGRTRGRRVEIFRLAGIYGPGRSPLDALRAGTARAIVKPGQVFNRIHVEDIATTLAASIARPMQHEVYNLADDEPAPSHEVIAYAAALMGVRPPPLQKFSEASLSPMAMSFYGECKRVDNARIKTSLGVQLAYPTYREGLGAIHAGMK
ncbi:MAG: SDR family oxidoreductase [Hyphomicrobiaceae bacterium]